MRVARGRRLVREQAGRTILIAALAGLVLGGLTQIGQRLLPDALQPLANSISPWITVSFLIGALSYRPFAAAVGGWLTLVFALSGYYLLLAQQYGLDVSTNSLVLWGVASVAGGFVFGPAGWHWRHGSANVRAVSTGLLAAAFIAESVYLFMVLQPDAKVGSVLFVIVGLALPLVLARSRSQRMRAYLAVLPSLGLAVVGYGCLLLFDSVVAGL